MDAEQVITPDFRLRAAGRIPVSYVPKMPPKSPIVQEIAEAFLTHRNAGDYRSTIDRLAHRFVIVYHVNGGAFPGVDAQASPSVERSENTMHEILLVPRHKILAVLRLEKDFESQWPLDRAGDELDQLIARPIDLRFQNTADVVRVLRPPFAE